MRQASTLDRAVRWLVNHPWAMQLITGLLWIYLAVISIGKGQDFAVVVTFIGMLFWALKEYESEGWRLLCNRCLALLKESK